MRTLPVVGWLSSLCLLAVLAIAGSAQGADLIPWAPNLDVAREQAARGNRLVMLHFWTTSCAPCRSLEQNVFSDQRVATAVGQLFVPVKIDAERFPDLAKQYGVKSWPTDVIITPSGHVVAKVGCPQSTEAYLSQLGQLASSGGLAAQGLLQAARNIQPTNFGLPPQLANPYAAAPPAGAYGSDTAAGTAVGATTSQPNVPTSGPSAANISQGGAWGGAAAAATAGAPASSPPPAWTPAPASQWAETAARYAGQQAFPSPSGAPNVGGATWDGSPPSGATAGQPVPPINSNLPPLGQPNLPARDSGQQWAEQRQDPYAVETARAPQPSVTPVSGTYGGGWGIASQPSPTTPNLVPEANPYVTNAPAPRAEASSPPGMPAPAQGMMVNNRSVEPPAPPKAAGPQIPAGNPPLAMDGFCPVTLRSAAQWKQGDVRFGAIHRGRTYLFAGQAEQQQFLAAPDDYSPMLSGIDPVRFAESGERVDGNRTFGVVYKGQVYLFADEGSLQRFWSAPDRYAGIVQQAMQPRAPGGSLNR